MNDCDIYLARFKQQQYQMKSEITHNSAIKMKMNGIYWEPRRTGLCVFIIHNNNNR